MRKILCQILTLIACVSAGNIDDSLRAAVFMFELQGRYHQAYRIFHQIAQSPDASPDEKTRARFYLGKISELISAPDSASQHYRIAQRNVHSPALAYWLAERRAQLDSRPTNLLQGIQQLPAVAVQSITGRKNGLVLANQQLWFMQNKRLQPSPRQVPPGATLHAADPSNLWFSDNTSSHTLQRLSIWNSALGNGTYLLDGPVQAVYPVNEQYSLATTSRSLFWLGNDRIQWKKGDRYYQCEGLGIYAPSRQVVINCPDNALHFFSPETGTEQLSLVLPDKIDRALLTDDGILVASGGSLSFFQPHSGHEARWTYTPGTIQDFLIFGRKIAVLGTDGSLALLNPRNGKVIAGNRSEAASLVSLGTGLIATLSESGQLSTYDTLLTPLWNYHFASAVQSPPLITDEQISFPLGNSQVVSLSSRYYGKMETNVQVMEKRSLELADSGRWNDIAPRLDSLIAMEKGNAVAWFLRARSTRRGDSTTSLTNWARAVQYARGKPDIAPKVLQGYARQLQAHFVRYLDVSPRTLYPRIFGDSRNLYVIDAAAKRLLTLSAQQGTLRWSAPINRLGQSPVLSADPRSLAIGSDFQVEVLDLQQKGRSHTIELPGKPFQLMQNHEALYITTWNGFLLKFARAGWQLAWSRKLFSAPAYVAEAAAGVFSLSLDGQLVYMSNQGQPLSMARTDMGAPAILRVLSPYVVIASQEDEIAIFQDSPGFPLQGRFSTEAQILSMEMVNVQNEPHLLVGLADQQLILYELPNGKAVWRYAGKGSVFMQPVLEQGIVWLDQQDALVGLSLRSGQLRHHIPVPGGSGPVFAGNGFLYSASRQKLLYAFPIHSSLSTPEEETSSRAP